MPRKRKKNVKKTAFIEEDDEDIPEKKKDVKKAIVIEEDEEDPVIEKDDNNAVLIEDDDEDIPEKKKDVKKKIVIEEDEEDPVIEKDDSKAVLIEEYDEETVDEKKGEEVWNAIEWEDVGPMGSEVVFDKNPFAEVLKETVDQAWEDGEITSDEMAILHILKSRLKIDDDTFDRIINERKPESVSGSLEEVPERSEIEEVVDEDENDLDEEEEDLDENWEGEDEEDEVIPGEVIGGDIQYFRKDEVKIQEKPQQVEPAPMSPPPKPPEMITFSHSIRGDSRPLDRSFDLTKKEPVKPSMRRCLHCRSLIKLDPARGRTACPVCGRKMATDAKDSPAIRKILDMAKISYKNGETAEALELYLAVKEQSPGNREALFYIQKLRSMGKERISPKDMRDISFLTSESPRLDQLLGGGIGVGDTVLVQGPPFCGKEVLLDQIMASALKKGVPVIYVSSNRAMKEVMRGIIKKLPDFKRYNHDGMVRMYDLFSKHNDDRILKEGHRIFNIEEREDFLRFQNDLVFVQEELVKIYHGGLLIINSLSPLISQVDQQDLMKFLQVLIARSKSYRFTNILDMAAGVHPESIVNSVEYLMDGIMEFRELDMKNTIRLKGFTQNIMSRDRVEYVQSDDKIRIVGSFMEERIL